MIKLLIAGDFSQKNRVNNAIRDKQFSLLFGEIRPILRSVDYSIVNFEFPIIGDDKEAKRIPKLGPHLEGTVEAVDAIKYAGFKCCTLANNHILDQGDSCCVYTKHVLESNGIDTVGAGSDIEEASRVLYKVINRETVAIINCAEHEFSIASDFSAGANPINPIQQYYSIREAKEVADYVIVIVHGGHEHYQLPSPRMQELYRFFINVGADAVINGHQHCFSGYEIFNNKPIVYGIGNLCFDNPAKVSEIWNQGYMVELLLDNRSTCINNIYPYTQCDAKLGVHPIIDRTEFNETLKNLNSIIHDSHRLKESAQTYYKHCSSYVLNRYQPYESRLLNKLYRLRLLPSLVSKKRWLAILNYIECESHRDKQVAALKFLFR